MIDIYHGQSCERVLNDDMSYDEGSTKQEKSMLHNVNG